MEGQSSRYAGSTFKWVQAGYRIRFAYEATGKLTRFTDYNDQKYRSRRGEECYLAAERRPLFPLINLVLAEYVVKRMA